MEINYCLIFILLPKTNRLVTPNEIKSAFYTRHKLTLSNFRIFLKVNQANKFQLLVIVPKKIWKKANKRNRQKRRIQSVFQEWYQAGRLPNNLSCIVQVTHKNLLFTKPAELKETLSKSLQSTLKQIKDNKYKKPN